MRSRLILVVVAVLTLAGVILSNPIVNAAQAPSEAALNSSPAEDYRWWRGWRPPPPPVKGEPPLELALPVTGYAYVTQGNDDAAPSHSGAIRFSFDFVKLGARWMSFRMPGDRIQDYYTWGVQVLAPAPGTVISVEEGVEDNPLGQANMQQQSGNSVIIKHAEGLYSQIDHFRHNGIVVKEGDFVERGQVLGYAGNSGWSYQPHIHYQLQEGPSAGALSVPARFSYYVKVDRMGEYSVRLGVPLRGDILRNGPWPRPPSDDN